MLKEINPRLLLRKKLNAEEIGATTTTFNTNQSNQRKFLVNFILCTYDRPRIIALRFYNEKKQFDANDIHQRNYHKKRHISFIEGGHHVNGYPNYIVLRKIMEKDGLVFYLENQMTNQVTLLLNAFEVKLLKGALASAALKKGYKVWKI